MFPECFLNVPRMFPECSVNGLFSGENPRSEEGTSRRPLTWAQSVTVRPLSSVTQFSHTVRSRFGHSSGHSVQSHSPVTVRSQFRSLSLVTQSGHGSITVPVTQFSHTVRSRFGHNSGHSVRWKFCHAAGDNWALTVTDLSRHSSVTHSTHS
jgi:hypothetical protein